MKTPIVLFPGLGADSKLFIEQKKHFGDRVMTPDWISPQKDENLEQFSHRFADHLMAHELAHFSEVFLGGFSFGGMLSHELANVLSAQHRPKIKGVILISSGRTQHILKDFFKAQAAVGSRMPDSLLRFILEKQMLQKFTKEEVITLEQATYLKQMVDTIDLNFFRWSLLACANWFPEDRFTKSEIGFPIFEIQGKNDEIIPLSREEGVMTLGEGKHLIQYTHAKELNQWLDQITQSG
jgi:surfactin synthase thioesterase subunit